MAMNEKLKGTICGVVAAISYGTNPLGALNLYADGINANTVLCYRFSLAAIILAGMMLVQRKSFRVTLPELKVLAVLGILFAVSSLTFFISFHHIDAGIAATLLFVYPVMVAVIMAIFFKEKLTLLTAGSILLALSGIGLLYRGEDGAMLSTVGVILVLISSLTYALYIIVVNKSPLMMSSVKLTFYVLLFCIAGIMAYSFVDGDHLMWLDTPREWFYAWMLGLVPTVISLVLMVMAVHAVGSTPTAIMGALEPLTAVVIGVTVFHEAFTVRLAVGILLILTAVLLIIAGKSVSLQRVTRLIGRVERVLLKYWRWKS